MKCPNCGCKSEDVYIGLIEVDCVNKMCKHYKENIIKDEKIKDKDKESLNKDIYDYMLFWYGIK